MTSDQYYFQPKCDPRVYEEAVERASYLIDNGYVRLTAGLTFEQVVGNLIVSIEQKEKETSV